MKNPKFLRSIGVALMAFSMAAMGGCFAPQGGRPVSESSRTESDEIKFEEQAVSWTDADTEEFWTAIIENATQTSTAPRLADADEERGEGVLETFGTQYLPNAYAYYQEVRATAKEREQIFRETFPDGRASDASGGAIYEKVRKATAKAVAEMFRRHDELCHYLFLYRMGAISNKELADLDKTRISVVIFVNLSEAAPPAAYNRSAPILAQAEIDFATKYLPETRAAFQRLDNAFSEGVKAYGEWRETALLVDAIRSDVYFFQPLRERLDDIHGQMDIIVRMVKEKKLLHAVGKASASDLADTDYEKGLAIQQFEKGLPVGPIVAGHVQTVVNAFKKPRLAIKEIVAGMVQIPDKGYKIGKTEVTQVQWESIMGENPSDYQGDNNPVENVSWNDCQVFLKKLNALPAVKQSGLVFRLPTDAEWEYACRAGATWWGYCKLSDGTEIKESTLGQVAWFNDNSDKKTHPVGQKKPNAFGLYDMHGNVDEWCQDELGSLTSEQTLASLHSFFHRDFEHDRVIHGGDWCHGAPGCEASRRGNQSPSDRSNHIGFRLCASFAVDLVAIPGRRFLMGRYEVTQAQWEAVMGENPAKFKGADLPVENVSWDDCQQFLKNLNALPAVKESGLTFRLPTEEEWGYACRTGLWSWGCSYGPLANNSIISEATLDLVAWFKVNSDKKTHPVGQKKPNAFGLYDMHGNVWEWTDTAEGGNRVICGGGWGCSAGSCECSSRNGYSPSSRFIDVGFRVCASGKDD